MWRLKLELSEQSNSSLEESSGKYAIKGLAIHLIGFVLGFLGIGLVLGGVIDIESGITVLVPFADMLYALGLIIVVAVAAKIGLPMKYLVVAGAVWNGANNVEDSAPMYVEPKNTSTLIARVDPLTLREG